MVKAIQVNSLGFVEWLLSLRPGLVLSLALHAALLLFLAIMLAFPPADPPAPEEKEVIIDMTIPTPPPSTQPMRVPTFQPKLLTVERITTTIKSFVIPPVETFRHEGANVVTAIEPPTRAAPPVPAQQIIVDPQPISRGGLIYPERAAEHDIPGYVDFSFIIEPDGSVGEPRVLAEYPDGYGLPRPP